MNQINHARLSFVCRGFALSLSFVICGNTSFTFAQEAVSSQMSRSAGTSVRSLDDLRNLNAREKSTTRVGVELPVDASLTTPKRQLALEMVRQIQASMAEDGDRSQIEKALRKALNEFFLADMQYRVEELDKIKRKVRETEATLQKRLEAKDESIDLQVKLLFQEADGISVFGNSVSPSNGSNANFGVGVPYDSLFSNGQPAVSTSR